MRFAARRLAVVMLATLVAGCGNDVAVQALAPAGREARLPGHVYLFWGLAGEIFSRGLDGLAAKIRRRGVGASAHSMTETGSVAADIVRRYRSDPTSAPVMLLGHSSGGDAIIAIAERLRAEGVPVALAFGFDPTPIAGSVPSNVDIFINLYQATNLIGGGAAVAGRGFRGRLINVDLRERREIVHITLDKSPVIHDLVVDKVLGVSAAAAAAARPVPAAPPRRARDARPPPRPPAYVLPLTMKYVVPPHEPIVLWDSAVAHEAGPGEDIDAFAARHAVPGWAVAQINGIEPNRPLQTGQKLLVPQSAFSAAIEAVAMPAPAPSR